MSQNDASQILSYQRPIPRRKALPNPVVATLLHLPGTCCWVIFICAMNDLLSWFPPIQFILVLWTIAVVTAILSFVLYLPGRIAKPWYVFINLFVNICGIIFTLFPGSILLLMILGICR